MKASDLRRHLLDDELERLDLASDRAEAVSAFRSIVDRLAETERRFALDRSARDKVAVRAASLLQASSPVPVSTRLAFLKGDWHGRAAAASALLHEGDALRCVGSLSVRAWRDGHGERRGLLDGAEAARALATAFREVGSPGVLKAQEELRGSAAVALRHERGGSAVWERALRPLLREFAWNAQGIGKDRRDAALEAIKASAVLTGQARQGVRDDLPVLLGSAARASLSVRRSEVPAAPSALNLLAEEMKARNRLRSEIFGVLEGDEDRLFGASAIGAVLSTAIVRRRSIRTSPAPLLGLILPEAWVERFAHLTAADAAGELERLAVDPRLHRDAQVAAEFASGVVKAHPAVVRVSFAEALGLQPPPLRFDRLPIGRLFRAAPRGKRPARMLCRGKNGRLIRCRAVADTTGAMVGYVAFDPLSREYGGRPLFAAYGLDGQRQGYAWADETLYRWAGVPEQGFVSVPESIPL